MHCRLVATAKRPRQQNPNEGLAGKRPHFYPHLVLDSAAFNEAGPEQMLRTLNSAVRALSILFAGPRFSYFCFSYLFSCFSGCICSIESIESSSMLHSLDVSRLPIRDCLLSLPVAISRSCANYFIAQLQTFALLRKCAAPRPMWSTVYPPRASSGLPVVCISILMHTKMESMPLCYHSSPKSCCARTGTIRLRACSKKSIRDAALHQLTSMSN